MAKQIRVKHGINTALSLALVVGETVDDETGEVRVFEQEEIFLPGATLPPNLAQRHVDAASDPESHLYEMLEVFDGDDVEEIVPEPEAPGVNQPEPEPTPEPEVPATPEPQADETTTVTGDNEPATESDPSLTPTPATAQPGEAPVNPFAPTDDAA